jgi:aryl-alcohol dehydrogenase-like predicted oxidoreductase
MHTVTQLDTTELGSTGLEITRVGFGAWAIGGGGWEFGWGAQDDEQSISAIHRALGHGINWIDTAAAYGFGRSERFVGRALANFDADQVRRLQQIAPVETLQPQYSLIERDVEHDILPFAERSGSG